MATIELPSAFADAFITYADEKNESDDELTVDAADDGRALYVCQSRSDGTSAASIKGIDPGLSVWAAGDNGIATDGDTHGR